MMMMILQYKADNSSLKLFDTTGISNIISTHFIGYNKTFAIVLKVYSVFPAFLCSSGVWWITVALSSI